MQLYGANLDFEKWLGASELLPTVVALEEKLSSWKRNLPTELRKRPWDASDPRVPDYPFDDSPFDRLSVIAKLRYLNVRILLHRPVLVMTLHRVSSVPFTEDSPDQTFVNGFEETSFNVCKESATEIVDIVFAASKSASLLGSSWFSSYYSEYHQDPLRPHFGSNTVAPAFNAALVLFNCILFWSTAWVRTRPTTRLASPETTTPTKFIDLLASLIRADEALQRLEPGTTMGARIGKAMSKLVRICKTLGQSHPSHSEAILRVLGPMRNPRLGSGVPQQDQQSSGLINTAILTPVTPARIAQRVPDPLSQMISPFAAEDDMDIFTDLGLDMDFGLTDLLTG